MPEPVTSPDSSLELIRAAPDSERDIHRELVFDNIEFLIDIMTAAHRRTQRMKPVGCPSATPERLARKRGKNGEDCRYATLDQGYSVDDGLCPCDDPLC